MRSRHVRPWAWSPLVVLAALLLAPSFDMYEEMDKIWHWQKPNPYPSDLGALDLNTLSTLLDAGNLQWYEPRPQEGKWDAVVMMKVHAPPEVIWQVFTDYTLPCKIMAKTFKACSPINRQGNQIRTNYTIETRALEYASQFAMNDLATEDPPSHLHFSTLEGGLKGREVDIQFLPLDDGRCTIVCMRYYSNMGSLGLSIQAVLKVLPDSEWPVAAASANYHLREHKLEAERRVGYTPPPEPGALKYEALDPASLYRLSRFNAGLIRETAAGKDLNGLAYAFIDAPPATVYELIADLEHYNERYKNQETEVKRREGNQVWAHQKIVSQSVLLFTFAYDMNVVYTLDPPAHLSYRCNEGTYEGSMGDYRIIPLEGGRRSLLLATVGNNFDKDTALTARLIRSGDYPFSTVMNLIAARTYLNNFKTAAEKSAKGK
jgi:hypothetical protein